MYCFIALFINYFADRFSLMRTWSRIPDVGPEMAELNRSYLSSMAVAAMAFASAYFWSGFPYDQLCPLKENEEIQFQLGDTVLSAQTRYQYCKQDFIRMLERSFPHVPKFQPEGLEWMTADQERLTSLYGWTSIVVMAAVAICWFVWIVKPYQNTDKEPEYRGRPTAVPFSKQAFVSSYLPEVKSNLFAYPFLAFDTSGLDEQLYDWKDPDREYQYYDLSNDVEKTFLGDVLKICKDVLDGNALLNSEFSGILRIATTSGNEKDDNDEHNSTMSDCIF